MADAKPNQTVSLGFDALILIALIVLIFGSCGDSELKKEIQTLTTEVKQLHQAIDAQNSLRKELQPPSRQADAPQSGSP